MQSMRAITHAMSCGSSSGVHLIFYKLFLVAAQEVTTRALQWSTRGSRAEEKRSHRTAIITRHKRNVLHTSRVDWKLSQLGQTRCRTKVRCHGVAGRPSAIMVGWFCCVAMFLGLRARHFPILFPFQHVCVASREFNAQTFSNLVEHAHANSSVRLAATQCQRRGDNGVRWRLHAVWCRQRAVGHHPWTESASLACLRTNAIAWSSFVSLPQVHASASRVCCEPGKRRNGSGYHETHLQQWGGTRKARTVIIHHTMKWNCWAVSRDESCSRNAFHVAGQVSHYSRMLLIFFRRIWPKSLKNAVVRRRHQ